ncbi:hypothetical protein EHQ12_09835 [Leptospira gomenensis]|uniref:Uncharacterized protein n=2 Tax=Leptospira gomenensis TaxID=2484974 RepID=A0A5F1Z1X4_9LEPT|nr:hypothetical protein [Leptospira gomenensis]TGK33778.1 hypothetical protein EHQ17_10435 [Leptospira gomenensis]TGK38701.1 hypothetical protein EHQ12_09835 [Leptospira gomenensis]TGK40588.1 hypothetical protein EHQ07_18105 [Leptospira gomenensis]TGK65338.1 hypothetical protein EHQ13_05120 [Leptospira gomenensis]
MNQLVALMISGIFFISCTQKKYILRETYEKEPQKIVAFGLVIVEDQKVLGFSRTQISPADPFRTTLCDLNQKDETGNCKKIPFRPYSGIIIHQKNKTEYAYSPRITISNQDQPNIPVYFLIGDLKENDHFQLFETGYEKTNTMVNPGGHSAAFHLVSKLPIKNPEILSFKKPLQKIEFLGIYAAFVSRDSDKEFPATLVDAIPILAKESRSIQKLFFGDNPITQEGAKIHFARTFAKYEEEVASVYQELKNQRGANQDP